MITCELSVIVVSYNTRELTLACLESVYAQTRGLDFEILVVDNDSRDGSATAIAQRFPQVKLITLNDNIGFARANNLAAKQARGEYILLLNPDTVVLDRAINKLLAFAKARPAAGIYGGRAWFGDGRLNSTSCWARSTPWSEFCHAVGLTTLFRRSPWLNPEGMGPWKRDTVRDVDIVTGCFLLIQRELWQRLDGFDPAFFMYGEEADLCLRARQLGAQPTICPDAEIIHYGGKSERSRADKLVRLLNARRRLIQRHWPRRWVRFGQAMQMLSVLQRFALFRLAAGCGHRAARERAATFREVWNRRGEWAALTRTGPPTILKTMTVGTRDA